MGAIAAVITLAIMYTREKNKKAATSAPGPSPSPGSGPPPGPAPFNPADIKDLTGWYKDEISKDGKKWLDKSGKGNDFVVRTGVSNVFTLGTTTKIVSTNITTLPPSGSRAGTLFSTLPTSNLVPSGEYTVFQVSRYVPGAAIDTLLQMYIHANTNGVASGDFTNPTCPSTEVCGYRTHFGMYAQRPECAILNERYANGAPLVEVLAGECNAVAGKLEDFKQITSQHLVYRLNSKNVEWYPNAVTPADWATRIKPPTPAQMKFVDGAIQLFAPFQMKELLIYNRKLKDDEIEKVEKYLNDKYVIYDST